MFTTSANFTAEILGELSNHQKRIESTVAVMDFLCLFVHVFAHLPLCMGLSIVSYLDKSIQLIASLYPFVFLSLWLFKSHFSTKFSAPPETSEEVQPCLSWNCLTFDFLVRGCIYHAALVHRLKRNHHVHWGYVCKFIEVDKKPGEWRSVPWPVEDMGQADQESQSRPGLLMYSWEMLRDVESLRVCWNRKTCLWGWAVLAKPDGSDELMKSDVFFLCVFCVCYVCLEHPKAFRNSGLRTLRRTPEGTTLQGLRTTSARRAKERSTSAPWTSDICHICIYVSDIFRFCAVFAAEQFWRVWLGLTILI